MTITLIRMDSYPYTYILGILGHDSKDGFYRTSNHTVHWRRENMTDVLLRPDMKTAGGEVNDIMWNNQFIGTMTLVYRESDRIAGAIQLEQSMLPQNAKQRVFDFLQVHIQSLIDALGVRACDVMVTYSNYDHIISTDEPNAQVNVDEDYDFDYDWTENERFEYENPIEQNQYIMGQRESQASLDLDTEDLDDEYGYYELVMVKETQNHVQYHIYDDERKLIAEAKVNIEGRDISGMITWRLEPEEEEIEAVADLLVSDFDEDEVDSFVLHVKWDDEIMETIELTHEDLLDEAEEIDLEADQEDFNKDDYTVVLARDDGDALTYEIYQQSHGGLPIGTATVDISHRQLTGFIDFREPGDSDDREYIATLLMRELDKEKDFESFNLTMLYQNKPFEELLFETEQVH
jgi:hypothetical protein